MNCEEHFYDRFLNHEHEELNSELPQETQPCNRPDCDNCSGCESPTND